MQFIASYFSFDNVRISSLDYYFTPIIETNAYILIFCLFQLYLSTIYKPALVGSSRYVLQVFKYSFIRVTLYAILLYLV